MASKVAGSDFDEQELEAGEGVVEELEAFEVDVDDRLARAAGHADGARPALRPEAGTRLPRRIASPTRAQAQSTTTTCASAGRSWRSDKLRSMPRSKRRCGSDSERQNQN